jgi:hypothetical protein
MRGSLILRINTAKGFPNDIGNHESSALAIIKNVRVYKKPMKISAII